MKIYTGKGDEGYTSLLGGSRVSKDDLQIEAYGTVDELNSWIGMLAVEPLLEGYKTLLQRIQHHLFNIGSLLAQGSKSNLMKLPTIGSEDIQMLEDAMDGMTTQLPPLKNFILPGSGPVNAKTHVGRTVCRRAERRVVALHQFEAVDSETIIYLNRLSDFLFVLGRIATLLAEEEEVKWSPA
ncbi:MAG: cob(I)yrinic acid a,c-diamide adenosyltransferase [Bacteroidota bacterium]